MDSNPRPNPRARGTNPNPNPRSSLGFLAQGLFNALTLTLGPNPNPNPIPNPRLVLSLRRHYNYCQQFWPDVFQKIVVVGHQEYLISDGSVNKIIKYFSDGQQVSKKMLCFTGSY